MSENLADPGPLDLEHWPNFSLQLLILRDLSFIEIVRKAGLNEENPTAEGLAFTYAPSTDNWSGYAVFLPPTNHRRRDVEAQIYKIDRRDHSILETPKRLRFSPNHDNRYLAATIFDEFDDEEILALATVFSNYVDYRSSNEDPDLVLPLWKEHTGVFTDSLKDATHNQDDAETDTELLSQLDNLTLEIAASRLRSSRKTLNGLPTLSLKRSLDYGVTYTAHIQGSSNPGIESIEFQHYLDGKLIDSLSILFNEDGHWVSDEPGSPILWNSTILSEVIVRGNELSEEESLETTDYSKLIQQYQDDA